MQEKLKGVTDRGRDQFNELISQDLKVTEMRRFLFLNLGNFRNRVSKKKTLIAF
jgi:hypothetical protein